MNKEDLFSDTLMEYLSKWNTGTGYSRTLVSDRAYGLLTIDAEDHYGSVRKIVPSNMFEFLRCINVSQKVNIFTYESMEFSGIRDFRSKYNIVFYWEPFNDHTDKQRLLIKNPVVRDYFHSGRPLTILPLKDLEEHPYLSDSVIYADSNGCVLRYDKYINNLYKLSTGDALLYTADQRLIILYEVMSILGDKDG